MARGTVRAFAIIVAAAWAGGAHAAIVTYNNQASFAAQVAEGFTLANLDAGALGSIATPYRVEDAAAAAAFLALGIDFFGFNAQVIAGQNGQTPTDRDRLIANGTGFGGEITINLSEAVNGLGALSNNIDFGRIRIFSGINLTGDFLGQVQFGPGSFGGITSDQPIRSAHFTCDFNQDRRCGVYDIQFGSFASVPEPGTLALLGAALACIGLRRRRPAR